MRTGQSKVGDPNIGKQLKIFRGSHFTLFKIDISFFSSDKCATISLTRIGDIGKKVI